MIYSSLFAVGAAFAGLASATTNFTTCCNVDPTTVDAPTRASWCRAQMNTCPLLCANGQTTVNTCDSQALTYSCECASGNTPNVSAYMQTLPSLECDEWRAQCTAASPNDLAGQTFCQSFVCGAKNASASVASGSSSSAASGSGTSATASGASSTASSSAAASSKAAAAIVKVGSEYGTVGVAGLLLAVFGFAL